MFPTWRFFEGYGQVSQLYFRTQEPGGQFGLWRPFVLGFSRRWSQLLLNPEGNLQMAYATLIDRLASEIEECDLENINEFSGLVSYQLVQNLVEGQVCGHSRKFQFKISASMQGEGSAEVDTLVSLTHTVGELGPVHE